MSPQVEVVRKLLGQPTLADPEHKVYQVQYQMGELPPHFIYVDEKAWTAEKEKELIKADMEKRLQVTKATLEI